MSTKFNMTRDINGYNGFGIQPTHDIQGTSLTANAAQTIRVPSNYKNWIAIMTYTGGANVFVDFTGATAAVPSSAFAAMTSSLNPSARAVQSGQTISFITPDTDDPYVTVEFQAILPYSAVPVQ